MIRHTQEHRKKREQSAMNDSFFKVITFDLDDTLWPVEPVIRQAEQTTYQWFTDYCPELIQRYTLDEITQYRQQFVQKNNHRAHQISQLRIESYKELLMDIGFTVFEANKIANNAFEVFIEARHQVSYFDEAIETLEKLQKNYILGALTNGNADTKRLGLDHLFTFHFCAEDIGSNKPNPGHFVATEQKSLAKAEQIIHVGDHPNDDILGAQQHGFNTVWINPNQTPWTYKTPAPNKTVASIADVIDAITDLENERAQH